MEEITPWWETWWIMFQTDPLTAILVGGFSIWVVLWVLRVLWEHIKELKDGY